ncbi:MAG: acyltransferase family protein [Deltaproteobacteria bacterium]|nr:acyltransferase family protein [Deltaproteobacteria bacterium]
MNDQELEARLSDFFDAAATYAFTPLTLLKFSKVFLGIERHDDFAGRRPERRDSELITTASKLFSKFSRKWFHSEIRGLHNLPEKGPGLIIGNHSGGMFPVDAFLTGTSIARYFGSQRPVYALAHDFLFREPSLAHLLERLGALRAGYDTAELAFSHNGLLIVYPGGDHETFREYTKKNRIDFAGRKGFVRLAIKSGVPIYPCVTCGGHETLYVLTRGEWIAEKFNLKKHIRTSVFPVVFSLPWGITSGFLPYFPAPSKITMEFLEPLTWPQFNPSDAENDAVINFCFNDVISKMQQKLDELSFERTENS